MNNSRFSHNLSRVITLSLGLILLGQANAFDYFQPLPDKPLQPKNNPLSKEKAALGKRLFFDKALAKSNDFNTAQLACKIDDPGLVRDADQCTLDDGHVDSSDKSVAEIYNWKYVAEVGIKTAACSSS